MNNNNLHKNSALFLAAVLIVGGVLGISSIPLTALAQGYDEYEKEKEYDSYDRYMKDEKYYDSYDPYRSDMKKDGKSSSNVLIANCELSLSNFNFIDQDSTQDQDFSNPQTQNQNPSETALLNGQELTPEEALNAIGGNSNGNSEPLLDLNRNVVSVCFANNDNDVTQDQTFTGGEQLQAGGDQAQ